MQRRLRGLGAAEDVVEELDGGHLTSAHGRDEVVGFGEGHFKVEGIPTELVRSSSKPWRR
jgi:hypothetical protein